MAYTTSKTRAKMRAKAYEYNISNKTNGYAVNLIWVTWASESQIEEYLAETGEERRDCDYIIVDTICENEYDSTYSNNLFAVIPLNEFSAREAKQIANALNNGVCYFEV